MKLNLKSTIAAPAGNKSCQKALNGIIGNTKRGIVIDKTLDPDSNNPVANKPVSTALAALAGKIDAALQRPTGLTKTKLVGVGAQGQENIEIGDNLTLANGKLFATGGGGGSSDINYLNASFTDEENFTGTFTGSINPNKINIIKATLYEYIPVEICISYLYSMLGEDNQVLGYVATAPFVVDGLLVNLTITQMLEGGNIILGDQYNIKQLNSHFITMTDSTNNIALYFTIQVINENQFTADTLAEYLAGKKVLVNGNLHGVVPTYIAAEVGSIKVYYRTPGDSNINPTPDEYQDLSSFTITDLVTPVE